MKVVRPSENPSSPWFAVVIVASIAIVAGFYFVSRPKADPEKLWVDAQAELKAGRGESAEAIVKQIVKLRTPTPLDDMLRAQIAIYKKRSDEALDLLARIPDDHAVAPQARLLAGQIELRRHRAGAAEKLFLKAIERDPKLVQARRELVYIYGVLLRRDALNEQFRVLSEISDLTFKDLFIWCLTRSTVWEPAKNLPSLREFVESDPGDRGSRLALAEDLRQLNRREEAEKVLQSIPNSDPEALAIRVAMAFDRGEEEETIQKLLKEGPEDNAELARMRGKIALRHKRGEEALRYYQIAYKVDPDHRDGQIGMAQSLTMVGDAKAAAPFLKRARDLEQLGTLVQRAAANNGEKDIPLVKSLGAACEQVGRLPEARAWYALALKDNPLDPEAQRAMFRIKKNEKAEDVAEPGGSRPTPRGDR